MAPFVFGWCPKVSSSSSSSRSPKDGACFKRLPKSSAIKVIDFGSTTYEHQDHSYIVSTRHYRAPEVILGTRGSSPRPSPAALASNQRGVERCVYVDCLGSRVFTWSICVLLGVGRARVELSVRHMERWLHSGGALLCTAPPILCLNIHPGERVGCESKWRFHFLAWAQGEALFQTHENLEHLAMMERVLGPIPQHMTKRAGWVIHHPWSFVVIGQHHLPIISARLTLCSLSNLRCSRHAEKYVRRGRLDWPEGAGSRESIRAVQRLPRLQVGRRKSLTPPSAPPPALLFLIAYTLRLGSFSPGQNLVMEHVDHSAGDLIDLLQGLLRYEPSERMTAREALRHPFFARPDHHPHHHPRSRWHAPPHPLPSCTGSADSPLPAGVPTHASSRLLLLSTGGGGGRGPPSAAAGGSTNLYKYYISFHLISGGRGEPEGGGAGAPTGNREAGAVGRKH